VLPRHAHIAICGTPRDKLKPLYERTLKMLHKKTPLFRNGVMFNLKLLSLEKFKHSFPIQTSVDVAAVGVVCALNSS
jgi:hypothetical protein